MSDTHRRVTIEREAQGVYRAVSAKGAELVLGVEGFSPVELLMVALAGCAALDVDLATTRKAEPEHFSVQVDAEKLTEPINHLEDVVVTFDVRFPDGPGAEAARTILPRAVRVTHDRNCTVSGTIEAATPVVMGLAGSAPRASA